MKVNVTAPLVGFNGEVITVQKTEDEPIQPMLLREIITTAILAAPQDGKADGVASFKNYQLASKVHKNDEVELTVEEITQLKQRIGEVYLPNVSGAAWMLLDPPAG
ncbi:MAG: hypothetical protein ACYTEQ_26485 [Planctomycetota bacterium]|jgi:hypothetical protein